MGIPVKDADAATFEVCDDGRKYLDGLTIPHGYGKDAQRVFYYNFDGKPNLVRKATAANFRSHNDGHFGQDENFAFFEIAAIPKANVATWRPLGGWFSKDDQRVYFCNRPLKEADAESFIAVDVGVTFIHLAKDKNHHWDCDKIITAKQYADKLVQFGDPQVYLKYADK